MKILVINNREEWEKAEINIGEKVQIKDFTGIFINEKKPHNIDYHSHNYLNPTLIVLDKKELPIKKVTFYEDFNKFSESKLTLEDNLIVNSINSPKRYQLDKKS